MSETYYTNSNEPHNPYKLVATSKSYAILEGSDGEEISVIRGSLNVSWEKVKPMTWEELEKYAGTETVILWGDEEFVVRYIGYNYGIIEYVDGGESILRNGMDPIESMVKKENYRG
ncbi:hypothetical protein phiOC_p103 [Ochrobactrum phage vB_OspM_OC]|nr:hypothetical protein phiOC_p103 [Ochrobactrum phage vB_OspM_OC]